MDPDVCRNCGHSGKHIDFADARCAITERDDAERDKLQADAALARARDICETSLSLMKRQMQELEDANEAIDVLRAALAAAEDRRERVRRDLGTHGDVCLLARSNVEAAEEMAISAAGRYFEAGRAVTALEDREQLRKQSPSIHVEEAPPLPVTVPMEEDDDAEDEAREKEDRRWKRSNERFCKWLRQSEAQRQIMKSSWTKLRVAERLAGESVNVDVDVDVDAVDEEEDEETARRKRVQAWTAARRLTDQLPPEEDPTMETEYLESEPTDSAETTEGSSEPLDKGKDRQSCDDGDCTCDASAPDCAVKSDKRTQPTDCSKGGEPDSLGTHAADDSYDNGDEKGEEGAEDNICGRDGEDGDYQCSQLRWCRRWPAGCADTGSDWEDPGSAYGSGSGNTGGDTASEGYEKEVGESSAIPSTGCSAEMEEGADALLVHTPQIE
ncbi:UbiD family decarboxylase [Colletotrichum lupini]|uniref:UbiD family decarboxylase n=1 Tax=Colletotrichum lupini TaxID=145971 RepID=A0A9Q8SCD5_9PEZI|nr:UbiD family decarboxylase [Colletotrichum lupini]UQC73922.1 UbiD family decarboxylase [Colletotrichum lupini]